MHRWRAISCFLGVALLTACASTPAPVVDAQALFADQRYAAPAAPVSSDALFTISPAMRRLLDDEIRPRLTRNDTRRVLLEALHDKGLLRLDYDAAYTRNAAEAFDARAGNCLSLLIMTAAFARDLGLAVRFQSVAVEETWARENGLLLAIGHVNLGLGLLPAGPRLSTSMQDWAVVDFYAVPERARQRVEVLDEARVRAMYLNNRAAETLAAGRVDEAYWWARAATLQDRRFATAFNTLAVVHQRRRLDAQAEASLRAALALDDEHPHALGNLAALLQRTGRAEESQRLAARLKRLQPSAPFAAFDEGLARLREGRVDEARALFERELGVTDNHHEVHFWLAVARLRLGDAPAAQRHLRLAAQHSTTTGQQAVYAAKLERLKAQAFQ